MPVTPHGFTVAPDDRTLARIDGELCVGGPELDTNPRNWLVQLVDHRLVTAERDGATMPAGDLEPGTCARGTLAFSVPADGAVRAVIYTYGGIYEEARWRVGG